MVLNFPRCASVKAVSSASFRSRGFKRCVYRHSQQPDATMLLPFGCPRVGQRDRGQRDGLISQLVAKFNMEPEKMRNKGLGKVTLKLQFCSSKLKSGCVGNAQLLGNRIETLGFYSHILQSCIILPMPWDLLKTNMDPAIAMALGR